MVVMDSILMFKDRTAWFSYSVQEERISQWKQNGGVVADFDSAQYIFSEDADCDDTKRIYDSEAYRNEHLAIFHAKYITDSLRVPNQLIGKYFLPPTEIQTLVRKQMKFIWDDANENTKTNKSHAINAGSTGQLQGHSNQKSNRSILESSGNNVKLADNSRLKKLNETDSQALGPASPPKKKKPSNVEAIKSCDQASTCSSQRQSTTSPRQTVSSPRHSKRSPKQTDSSQRQLLRSPKQTDSSQRQSLRSPRQTESSSRRSLRSPRGQKQGNLNESSCSYSLRERLPVDYSDPPHIDVDGMVIDCNRKPSSVTSPKNSKKDECSSSLADLNNQDCTYFNINELPKVTSELEDLVPGRNGFEVMAKS